MEVLRRDKFRCFLCRSEQGLEVHHIISRRYDHAWRPENMVVLCHACHMGLYGRPNPHSHEQRKRLLNLMRDRYGCTYTRRLWLEALEEMGDG